MTTVLPLRGLIPTVLLGAASTLAILWAGVSLGVVLVTAGAAFIVLLPRHPRAVDGVLVEHDCAEPPHPG